MDTVGGVPAQRVDLDSAAKVYHLPAWKDMNDPARLKALRQIALEAGRDPRIATLAIQIIRKAGMLESETCGKWTYFRIARGHLPLLRAVLKNFPGSGLRAADLKRAEARLARREDSCCPGPVKLAKSAKTTIKP